MYIKTRMEIICIILAMHEHCLLACVYSSACRLPVLGLEPEYGCKGVRRSSARIYYLLPVLFLLE